MNGEHVTYPNPIITEAICDIHFRLAESYPWKPSFPGELFKQIQNDYPEMEPVVEMGVQLEFGPSGTSTKILPQSQKIRFKHGTRSLIIQLGEESLSISVLAPYQGWKMMMNDTLSIWEQVKEVLHPGAINRIGLRFINRINREVEQERPGDWFVANNYFPKTVLNSEPGFLMRVQTRLDRENTLIVTLGDIGPESGSAFGAFIFDIDRIVERELSTQQSVLKQEIDWLHTGVWSVFSSARGERLEALLERRK
jgi:uncharacterized protein (TIGR04255 family)